ncbi:MAG: helix-turn-helix domain-containing protein [Bacteroidota bacterium]|nr:helix-turn-helix domain-containing protein [Bacteroidota bacterium]
MDKVKNQRSLCPISSCLDIWGDKWSLLIVRDIMFFDKNTYGEFSKSMEKIATNILASRLVDLEQAGLISREEHPESKAKIFYKLTPKGIDLMPIIAEMNLWAAKYYEIGPKAKEVNKILKKDKVGFIKSRTAVLKKL